jgi:hypothetical protein
MTNTTNVACANAATTENNEDSGAGMVVVAIVCVVISSLTTTFGLFFQKIAQERMMVDDEDISKDEEEVKAFHKRTTLIWLAGFVNITLLSFALDLFSMATLGQAMVVPLLASLEVAENQMAAPAMLHEHFDKVRDTSAAIIITIGALCTTLFGPGGPFGGTDTTAPKNIDECGNSIPMTYEQTKEEFGVFFSAPAFIIFEILTISMFIGCVVGTKMEKFKKYHFLFYGYIAGFLGGQQNMFLKGVGTCFGSAFAGDAAVFADYLVYVFIIAMASLAGTQLGYLNRGLAKFPALLFVPTYTVLYIVMGTCVGMVFYQEYKLMSTLGWVMFCIGFLFIFAALTILATKKGGDEEVIDEETHAAKGISTVSSDKDKNAEVKVIRKLTEHAQERTTLGSKALSMMFVAHPKDKHHPANGGLTHSHRSMISASNARHSKLLSSKKNNHIMIGFGGGLMTSHRVMNADLKTKIHLPKNHKFKSVVHTLVAKHRLSALLKLRKNSMKTMEEGDVKDKEIVEETTTKPKVDNALTAVDVSVVIDDKTEEEINTTTTTNDVELTTITTTTTTTTTKEEEK